MTTPLKVFSSLGETFKRLTTNAYCTLTDFSINAFYSVTGAPYKTYCDDKRPDEPEVPNRPVDKDFDYPDPRPSNTIVNIDIDINNTINIIKPPPRIIYAPRFNIEIEYPEIPDRTLPDIERSPELDITSPVKESLANHKFGCLLARPFTTGEYEWCDYNLDDPSTFWDNLIDKAKQAIQDYLDSLVSDATATIDNACKLSVALLNFNFLAKPVLIIGCQQITDISKYYEKRNYNLNNFRITGKLHLGDLTIKSCPIEQEELEDEDFSLELINSCGIPLQLYEDNEGIKPPQLQILWRSRTEGAKKIKQMTFPNPINPDQISTNFLKAVLPSNFYFGDVLYYIELKCNFSEDQPDNLKGNAKMRIFGSGEDRSSQNTFIYTTYQEWLRNISPTTEIKGYTPIIKTDTRWVDQFEGDFYPYSATWMCWSKEEKIWLNVAKWFIYRKLPN